MKDGAKKFQGCCNSMGKPGDGITGGAAGKGVGWSAGKAVTEIAERLLR